MFFYSIPLCGNDNLSSVFGLTKHQVPLCNIFFALLFHKGDASKTGSEIDSVARSMEDVNGSKKDLSPSTGKP